VKIIIDTAALNDKSDVFAKGLSEGEMLVRIKCEDIKSEPDIGKQITINGKRLYVRHCLQNCGEYELRLGRTKGNA